MPVNFEDLVHQITIRDFLRNESDYIEVLSRTQDWSKIPLLKHDNIQPSGSLVRFRGMIQDMFDPEYYLERYEVKTGDGQRMQDGKFVDFLQIEQGEEEVNFSSENNKHGERRSLFLVTIPGINNWADEGYKDPSKLPEVEKLSVNPSKRQEDGDDDETLLKRQKVIKDDQTPGETRTILSTEYLVNSPLPDRPSRACLVKIYRNFESFRLNTVIDVVGFLSVDPALDGSTEEVEEMLSPEEHIAKNPPPSLIPRLHAISTREVHQIAPFETPFNGNFPDISRDILMVLTQCLFGDQLAGRYLFAHLLSSIQSRVGMEILGKMCLNLINLPGATSGYTKSLYEILEAIVPVSYHLEMSLENLNTFQFVPKKDYNTGKLTSGILQLAPNSHLILDETCLEPGQLQGGGIEAVKSLSHLIRHQSVEADFQFYRLEYESNIPVLILGEGKSLLPSDILVPLKPDSNVMNHIAETYKAAHQFIRTRLEVIRGFLASQKVAKFDLYGDIQTTVQEDLVTMRKTFNASSEELHSLLTLSRLVGKSMGKSKLDEETWELVKNMDQERRQRMKK
ncbi:mini-chromosome maintenance complex-binding protein [Lutzomyia longipalpis]|uniref:mini-chromosome maintenance complex-binding protein n=1 Tax=Lutzomyia longipalpis TaxID=7200 RepID=UPI0024840C31|nr:mini-chromosome maintenance complex-binding protein [Lutzomyia longipalpis]